MAEYVKRQIDLLGISPNSDAGYASIAKLENARFIRPHGYKKRGGWKEMPRGVIPSVYPHAAGDITSTATLVGAPLRVADDEGEILAFTADNLLSYIGSGWSDRGDVTPWLYEKDTLIAQSGGEESFLGFGNVFVNTSDTGYPTFTPIDTQGFLQAGRFKFADIATFDSVTATIFWVSNLTNVEGDPVNEPTLGLVIRSVGNGAVVYENLAFRPLAFNSNTGAYGAAPKIIASKDAFGNQYFWIMYVHANGFLKLLQIDVFGNTVTESAGGIDGVASASGPFDMCQDYGGANGEFATVYYEALFSQTRVSRRNPDGSIADNLYIADQPDSMIPFKAMSIYVTGSAVWVGWTIAYFWVGAYGPLGAYSPTKTLLYAIDPVAWTVNAGSPYVLLDSSAGKPPADHLAFEQEPLAGDIVVVWDAMDTYDQLDSLTINPDNGVSPSEGSFSQLLHTRVAWQRLTSLGVSVAGPFSIECDGWLAGRPYTLGARIYLPIHQDDVENGTDDFCGLYCVFDGGKSAPLLNVPSLYATMLVQGGSDTPVRCASPFFPLKDAFLPQGATPYCNWVNDDAHDLSDTYSTGHYGYECVNAVSHVAKLRGAVLYAMIESIERRAMVMSPKAPANGADIIPSNVDALTTFFVSKTAVVTTRLIVPGADFAAYSTERSGSARVVALACPRAYDGRLLGDAAFLTAPKLRARGGYLGNRAPDNIGRYSFVALDLVIGTSGLADDTTYRYVMLWKYEDSRGNVYRSPPSQVVSRHVSAGQGANTIILIIAPKRPPQNWDFMGERITCEVYRAQGDRPGPFYKLCELQPSADTNDMNSAYGFPAPENRANSFIDNGFGFQSYVQEWENQNTFLPEHEQLYTGDGVAAGELPNDPAPASKQMIVGLGRMWACGLENPNQVAYSKAPIPGRPIEWSSGQVLDMPEPIRALGALDTAMVAFGESGRHLIVGQGPDRNGNGPGFAIQRVPGSVTCHNAQSVLSAPAGVFFQAGRRVPQFALGRYSYSSDGVFLLGRDFSTQNVGSPIQKEFVVGNGDQESPIILGNGVVRAGSTEVIYSTVFAEKFYVYDWAINQWAIWKCDVEPLADAPFPGVFPVSVVESNSQTPDGLSPKRLIAASVTRIYEQTGFQDQQSNPETPIYTWIPMQIEIGPIYADTIGGWQMHRNLVLSARSDGPHNLVVSFAYDNEADKDEPSYTDAVLVASEDVSYPLVIRVPRPKCRTLKILIADDVALVRAAVTSSGAEPFTLPANTSVTYNLDGGAPHTALFAKRVLTSKQVVDAINAAYGAPKAARFFSGAVQILGGTIIIGATAAATDLGFAAGTYFGSVVGSSTAPLSLTVGSVLTLTIDGVLKNVPLATTTWSAAEVVDRLNATTPGHAVVVGATYKMFAEFGVNVTALTNGAALGLVVADHVFSSVIDSAGMNPYGVTLEYLAKRGVVKVPAEQRR